MKPKSLSTSNAYEDDFVLKILNYPKKAYYLDFGSGMPFYASNSCRLEEVGWDGLCIDIGNDPLYRLRNCKFYSLDALEIDYISFFESNNVPNVVDYLSLDIDEHTTQLLQMIPFNNYTFKIITIEHDAYCRDTSFRDIQRKHLTDNNYHLLCSDVWPDILKKLSRPCGPFEDWWIKKEFFSEKLYKSIQSHNIFGQQIINKFGFSSFDLKI